MSLRRRILFSPEFNGHSLSPPPPPSPPRQLPSHVIIVVASAASVFLAIVYYAVLHHRRRQPPFAGSLASGHDTFATSSSDSDHPIWHIKTVGLDDSAIESIGSYAHRGAASAADCSVCLGDLVDGETVRLLPQCRHVFHVQCIDTWLRSQVNCPLCRTAVVVAPPAIAARANVDGDPAADDRQLEEKEEEVAARVSVEDSPEGLESSETAAGASRSISMDSAAIGGILFRVDEEKEGNCSKEGGSEKGQSESGRGFLFSRLGRARSSSLLPL